MDRHHDDSQFVARFEGYVDKLSGVLGHRDRHQPFREYCTGLLLTGGRKSVEPMAARLAPAQVSAKHQSLLHFVGQSPWSSEALLAAVRAAVLPALEARAPVEAWIIDDTGFPKKGTHSVGVARQYCGQLGKQDNCQVAVSLSLATAEASLPVTWQLYLPKSWAADAARRKTAKVPDDIAFASKPEIALAQVAALADDPSVPEGVVLADSGYGADSGFRDGLAKLGLTYIVGVLPQTGFWQPGTEPVAPVRKSQRGRPPKRLQRRDGQAPRSAKALALGLAAAAWQEIAWREGSTAEPLASRFAALRVRPSHRDEKRREPWPEVWLLVEWPEGEDEPTKYWLSNLPTHTSLERLVWLAKLRWLIERDYRELKQELGLGHYEGRGWPGFHHHAALAIAAYGFLLLERLALPPSGARQRPILKEPPLPQGYRPRGSPDPATAPSTRINRDTPHPNRPGSRKATRASPMLHETLQSRANNTSVSAEFMTQ